MLCSKRAFQSARRFEGQINVAAELDVQDDWPPSPHAAGAWRVYRTAASEKLAPLPIWGTRMGLEQRCSKHVQSSALRAVLNFPPRIRSSLFLLHPPSLDLVVSSTKSIERTCGASPASLLALIALPGRARCCAIGRRRHERRPRPSVKSASRKICPVILPSFHQPFG